MRVALMPSQHRRRWQSIKTTRKQRTCMVSAKMSVRSNHLSKAYNVIPRYVTKKKKKSGGPRVVVSTAAFHARIRGSVPGLGGLKETKNVSSPFTWESQYCGEPPWTRGSVLDLRPPGLIFQILCLEDSVISIISTSSGGSPGQLSLSVHKGGLKPDSFHLCDRKKKT